MLIDEKLKKNVISKTLVSKFSLTSDYDFKSFEITDPLYLPFYYYLGQELSINSFLELGFGLGICSGCFLTGCRTIKRFIGFQESSDAYYPIHIAKHNIKRVYKNDLIIYHGNLLDERFNKLLEDKPDFILIREKNKEKMSQYLDFAWNILSYDKMICCDYIDYSDDHVKTFDVFCKIRNRDPVKFKTRYGVGIIIK